MIIEHDRLSDILEQEFDSKVRPELEKDLAEHWETNLRPELEKNEQIKNVFKDLD